MELILVCIVVGIICLVLGIFMGHTYATSLLPDLVSRAMSGLNAEEQAVIDWWRITRGKAPSAPAGGTAAPATATTTGTGAPPASAS